MAIGGDLALLTDDPVALVVDDGDDGARQRPSERARPDRVHAGAVADEPVELGLAVALVDGAAEELLRPPEEIGAQDLGPGEHRPQREVAARQAGGPDDP